MSCASAPRSTAGFRFMASTPKSRLRMRRDAPATPANEGLEVPPISGQLPGSSNAISN